MAISFASKSIRKSFGRVPEVAPMPNLIEVQKSSYDHFLQMGVAPEQRSGVGLQEVFKSVFPIRDFSERAQLEFVRYELEHPKYEVDECQQRGITFAAPLKPVAVPLVHGQTQIVSIPVQLRPAASLHQNQSLSALPMAASTLTPKCAGRNLSNCTA